MTIGAATKTLAVAGVVAALAVPAVAGSPLSPWGRLLSARWSWGAPYVRQSLRPVPNPNPGPEPQPLRAHPYDVVVSGDGRKVYVGLQGNELQPGSELAVVDAVTGQVTGRIALAARPGQEAGSSPYRLTRHPGGRFIVVTNRYSNFASVVDTRTDRVVSEIPLDFYCQGAVFSADGRTLYVANRYLDQVLVVDVSVRGGRFVASLRERPGLDARAFTATAHPALQRRCGAGGCHSTEVGGFVAGADVGASFASALGHVTPGDARGSRLLRAVLPEAAGGYADHVPLFQGHAKGTVVFPHPERDPDYEAIARWIDAAEPGPGIPVGNPRSKPKVLALSSDGRHLFVGNTGTQDISVVDTRRGVEVGSIYVQNVVNDLALVRSPETGHDHLVVTTQGIGFGVAAARDPYGGETWDRDNPAVQLTVWRDPTTGTVLPRDQQEALGPYDAVDGTAAIKFRDIQNDLLVVDTTLLPIPEERPAAGLERLLVADRYESHRAWVRYTSDTAESTAGDMKGDIPPDLMRVEGALPEKLVVVGDRVFVTMQGSALVQELRLVPGAADPSDVLVPVATLPTGMLPTGIAAGPPGTPAAGKLFVANFLGGSITILDPVAGTSREVIVDPSVERLPVPATDAERGEVVAHSAVFSSDGDTTCVHCHYLDIGDGRPWGVSQVVGQERVSPHGQDGQLVIGGTMGVPQMRALFGIQPFFYEGAITAYEPRSMLMEHIPADDFARETPQGDFAGIEAQHVASGVADVQSRMAASTAGEASLDARRDAMLQVVSARLFGKAFVLRDLQRFVGEWQVHEPRLLPNPYDGAADAVARGKELFEKPQVGCASCHPAPHFAKKDLPDNPTQVFPPQVTVSVRDGSFTLVSMNRLDAINGVRRDLEPLDPGRVEREQGHYTAFQLRGLWDRPPVFLHNGLARTLREVVAAPGHPCLGVLPYEPLLGGVPERPGRREVGFNVTALFAAPSQAVKMHLKAGARLGTDTHGGTSQLTRQQVDDLLSYLLSIE